MNLNRRSFLRSLLLAPFATKGIATALYSKPEPAPKSQTLPRIERNFCAPGVHVYSSDYIPTRAYPRGQIIGFALKTAKPGDFTQLTMNDGRLICAETSTSLVIGTPVEIGKNGTVRAFSQIL